MTPPSPSIAGLIAELREQTEVMLDMAHRGECDSFNGKLMRRAADALEKQAVADETRVRDISRLTIERDTARDAIEAMARLHGEKSQQYVDERKAHEATKADLAACRRARAALQPKVETP